MIEEEKKIQEEEKIQKAYFQAVFGEEEPCDEKKEGLCKEKIKAALDCAHEIRRFEIGLYWQRSLFFWGFITTFFGAFMLLFQIEKRGMLEAVSLVILSYLGVFTAFAWEYIARGSKSWMQNWEGHIDFLESRVTGNLYKTTIGTAKEFYSVSNIHLSFVCAVEILWIILSMFAGYELFLQLHKSEYSSNWDFWELVPVIFAPVEWLLNQGFWEFWLATYVPIAVIQRILILQRKGWLGWWRTRQKVIPTKESAGESGDLLYQRSLPDILLPKNSQKENKR